MCKIDELQLSADHKSVMIDGTWVELRDAIERIAFIKPECEKCEKTTFLKCIQDDGVSRLARCEMIEGAKLFENMGSAPPPQTGRLYELYLEKNAKLPEVVEGPVVEPEPPKKTSLVDKILGRV